MMKIGLSIKNRSCICIYRIKEQKTKHFCLKCMYENIFSLYKSTILAFILPYKSQL